MQKILINPKTIMKPYFGILAQPEFVCKDFYHVYYFDARDVFTLDNVEFKPAFVEECQPIAVGHLDIIDKYMILKTRYGREGSFLGYTNEKVLSWLIKNI